MNGVAGSGHSAQLRAIQAAKIKADIQATLQLRVGVRCHEVGPI